jgi:hypothetical protein
MEFIKSKKYTITASLLTPLFVVIGTPLLGFTSSGIYAKSLAAKFMTAYGGTVAKGSICATLQSIGVLGLSSKGVLCLSSITFCTTTCINNISSLEIVTIKDNS